ncbi:MAG TPA: hydroxyacid dehydrogenase [Kocuria sp.]|uniref:NAD(P)-dependent oxidoreductase n=1 Tax=Kocuria rhizophila TaxID=72000 RepID=UPI000E933E79|nr:NAD(P)-dependent oxidoreductase [Kocuria rhizophila]HAG64037.1 hydroxyacid dehydrogenase [Kocuria sp.]MBK4119585.1 hydroxyacid dehydrogenase [Kocuria rhizophila]MCC5671778.1 hydroxyacid dehydrogenase [Kocuria rhizophila]MCC5673855.1 hydroxyacid dehydrogenase [Kocuria rhizophila]HBH55182.1 hydroxyacid dehydrogenase [Kocuria sp.]
MSDSTSRAPSSPLRVISLPEQRLFDEISAVTEDFRCVLWDLEGEPQGCAREDVDIAVAPYYSSRWRRDPSVLEHVRLLQLQSTGYDGVPELLGDGTALAAAGWVHAAGTAEIALGLIIAAQRHLDRAVLQQHEGVYRSFFSRAVADSRVTLVGVGEIGRAVAARLEPFEVDLTRVASTARDDASGHVHGIAGLPEILPRTDILVLALPLNDSTAGLVGERLLRLLPDDALVVNVGRGPVLDTDALTSEVLAGRLRCALDVVDPEPLPGDHPLMGAAGSIVLPHVGGSNVSYRPRVRRLILEQLELIRQGRAPQFLVKPGGFTM